jgi:hypothetical protein
MGFPRCTEGKRSIDSEALFVVHDGIVDNDRTAIARKVRDVYFDRIESES